MATWFEFVCLECGHGGLTREPDEYRHGRIQCPRCGGIQFELQERDLAPLPEDEEEQALEVED